MGTDWLKTIGLENEYRINNRGVLKKKLTPFRRNSELVKSINKEMRAFNRVHEISFSQTQNWKAQYYINSDSDMGDIRGAGSSKINAGIDHESPFFAKKRTLSIGVVVVNEDVKVEAAQFIGILLGPVEEANVKKALGVKNSGKISSSPNRKLTLEYKHIDGLWVEDNSVNVTEKSGKDENGNVQSWYMINRCFGGFIYPLRFDTKRNREIDSVTRNR